MLQADMKHVNHRDLLLYGLLFALALLLVYLRAMPFITAMPATDQGYFLYIGKAILSGQVLYRDIWDHKGPVIFFIDALGFALAGKSAWGVWAVEYCSMLLAALWGFITLSRAFGQKSAALGTLLWIFSLVLVMEEGNSTETYALIFSFLIFANYLHTCRTAPLRRSACLIGVCGALCFFERPNLIGALLVCVTAWTVQAAISHRWRAWATNIIYTGLGFLCVTLLISGYFLYYHALGAMYDAMLYYNMKYAAIHHSVSNRIYAAAFGMIKLGPLSFIAVLMWCAVVKQIRRIASRQNVLNDVLLFALISMPIEFVLAILAGNNFYHYFVMLLLPISILTTWGVAILLRGISLLPNWLEPDSPMSSALSIRENYVCFALLLIMVTPYIVAQKPYILYLLKPATLRTERRPLVRYLAADYITSHTAPGDSVYIWGFDFCVLYAAKRHSPIKYSDIMPFITPNYDPQPHIASFLHDLTEHSPRLIIDMTEPDSTVSLPKIFGHNDIQQARAIWAYICQNYHQVEIAPGAIAYQRKM